MITSIAPSLNAEISDSGIIEGGQNGFPVGEVNFLLSILNAGSLPATLNPTPLLEEKVGPTLGQDTIAKGIRAIFISMIVVPIFMVIYYRVSGLIAVIALILNLILLVGFMSLTASTFTLPGLAGLSLTIGMAVDANVLIFERMREEKDKGARCVNRCVMVSTGPGPRFSMPISPQSSPASSYL